ncbi:hypothetical protein AK830_g780 [Neonectria ditissima]|uniref:Uncharacterized protein n=1 Tax=Neonectria ditissima TaxID=78410 RepID=A0A0P7BVC0_9HYPO|nr:hypothetical protein AK830_g780 [Neonectria ditissima]
MDTSEACDGPICNRRKLDWISRNIQLKLNIPWIQYPGNPSKDAGANWRDVKAKAQRAVQEWHLDMEVLLAHEVHAAYLQVACIVLLMQHLRLIMDDEDDDPAERHLRMFYAVAADELALLVPVRGLRLPSVGRL